MPAKNSRNRGSRAWPAPTHMLCLMRRSEKEIIMKRSLVQLLAVLLAAWVASSHAAPQSEEEELALTYGDKSFVTIATGSRQPIARAPSVATVVTAEDIAAIGAADLDEVLETVPGIHVSRSPIGYNPIYTIRGINTQYNPQVLMLVNGIPITAVYVGDRSQIWGGMPGENIARIEVIRGPGSALYGRRFFRRDQHHHQDCRRYQRHATRFARRLIQQPRCLDAIWWCIGRLRCRRLPADGAHRRSAPNHRCGCVVRHTIFPRPGAGQPRLRCDRWPD